MNSTSWWVLQVGAREHYAIPRALHLSGKLQALLTDCWVPNGSLLTRLPASRRLAGRWHADLSSASVQHPGLSFLFRELLYRSSSFHSSRRITHARNKRFQLWASRRLSSTKDPPSHLFSYAYAAGKTFRIARDLGITTILGQIDCGPSEDSIVVSEIKRYPHVITSWRPEPPEYWDQWSLELSLSDRIVVNSEWSKRCLLLQGIPSSKLCLVPLIYEKVHTIHSQPQRTRISPSTFKLLFLGTIGLRKGVARLLDAMRILEGYPIQLTLAGHTELDPELWANRPNIRWIGPLARDQVFAMYACSDAMILPTLSDGFAITQLEALAHNCPVIASRHCGDVVSPGRNGWLLPDLEPESIALTILEAYNTYYHLPHLLPFPNFHIRDLAETLQSLDLG